ncbi:ATP-dependent nuclease [Actinomadura kijaniata]|uniref:ATP-dependent nuclease n=1 Tax=Actinomadura kijaniata TaxID=46161 RepID=UPI003F1A31AF
MFVLCEEARGMKLAAAQVRDYRSVHDSTPFEIEVDKTIAVGANEAGKTALLLALQTINPPDGKNPGLDPLRDYPRSRYTEISKGQRDPADVQVAQATFTLEPDDVAALREVDATVFADATTFILTRYLDNHRTWSLPGVPWAKNLGSVSKDLTRLKAHLKSQEGGPELIAEVESLLTGVAGTQMLSGTLADQLDNWLERVLPVMDEDDEKAEAQFDRIRAAVRYHEIRDRAGQILIPRVPVFVYYSQYFSVRPRIHLANLAQRQASGEMDQDYDFGNLCLLELLGFSAKELSEMDSRPAPALPPNQSDQNAMAAYRQQVEAWQAQRDKRQYELNAASVLLTKMIRKVWGDEQLQLRLVVDGQYLKVVVVDDLGVEVELDQRSEGFRWLVSFFVVFHAQAKDKLNNAILLLDEPGLHLHALKQREFRSTVSQLAENNQIIYTTHSPFMVGSDELHLVRLVEMTDRTTGTRVHSHLVSDDPRSVFPLQAALGYDLAQSMFSQRRNLVVEGLTDLWVIEGVAAAMREAGVATIRDTIAIVPAQSASKVVYYCTLLHSQRLKIVALLDSDAAGEKAATQDELVHLLRSNQILRTKDHYTGSVTGPEIEDLLRDTLVEVARTELGWDVTATAASQPARRIIDIFKAEVGTGFSKYKLIKAFLRWLSTHEWTDLTPAEQQAWTSLTAAINKGLS